MIWELYVYEMKPKSLSILATSSEMYEKLLSKGFMSSINADERKILEGRCIG